MRTLATATTLTAGLMLTTIAGSAHGEIYRWVDADGVVNYTEHRPTDQEATEVRSAFGKRRGSRYRQFAAPVASTTPPPASTSTPQTVSSRRQQLLDALEANERKRQSVVAEVRQKNCSSSKRLLAKLQQSGRIRLRDESGREVAISDEDRAARIRTAQENIANNCESLS